MTTSKTKDMSNYFSSMLKKRKENIGKGAGPGFPGSMKMPATPKMSMSGISPAKTSGLSVPKPKITQLPTFKAAKFSQMKMPTVRPIGMGIRRISLGGGKADKREVLKAKMAKMKPITDKAIANRAQLRQSIMGPYGSANVGTPQTPPPLPPSMPTPGLATGAQNATGPMMGGGKGKKKMSGRGGNSADMGKAKNKPIGLESDLRTLVGDIDERPYMSQNPLKELNRTGSNPGNPGGGGKGRMGKGGVQQGKHKFEAKGPIANQIY